MEMHLSLSPLKMVCLEIYGVLEQHGPLNMTDVVEENHKSLCYGQINNNLCHL